MNLPFRVHNGHTLKSVSLKRDYGNYLTLILLSALICVGLSLYEWGWRLLVLLLASLLPALAVEFLFARFRKMYFFGTSFVFSCLLVLMLPTSTPLYLVASASVFGILIGQEIFGGSGYHIVTPALLAKLYLMIGYLPEIQGAFFASPVSEHDPHFWIFAGVAMMIPLISELIRKPSGFFVLGGALTGLALSLGWMYLNGLAQYDDPLKNVVFDSTAFVICFFLFDPACIPRMGIAKVVYGLLVICLGYLISIFSNKYSEGIVVALLFGNLVSPLLDVVFPLPKAVKDE